MAHALPEAITAFMNGLDDRNPDAALAGFALGAVVIKEDVSYRGTEAIRDLLASSSERRADTLSWKVDYAMDSEFLVRTGDDRQLQFLLDCGRIAYLRIAPATVAADALAAA
jgi:hypothetical protein